MIMRAATQSAWPHDRGQDFCQSTDKQEWVAEEVPFCKGGGGLLDGVMIPGCLCGALAWINRAANFASANGVIFGVILDKVL